VNFRVLYICILHFILHFIHIKRRWTKSKKQVVQNIIYHRQNLLKLKIIVAQMVTEFSGTLPFPQAVTTGLYIALTEYKTYLNIVLEICALLGYYAASNRNPLPTFRDNVSVPSSRVKKSKKKRREQISSTSRRKPEITNIALIYDPL
jgi:hypothetical protein